MAATTALSKADDILFIGNSFTFGATVPGLPDHGGVPKMVEAIARSKGIELTAEAVTAPGQGWSYHLGKPATAAALGAKTWSWVVLQDFSTEPTRIGNIDQFMRDGATFSQKIALHSPHAGILLYETWARPPGDFYRTPPGSGLSGPGQMMSDLHRSYGDLAEKLAAINGARPVRVALVGTAFARCHDEFPDIPLDAADMHHATTQGYYLAAMVIFESIYHRSATDSPLIFFDGVVTISPADAAKLQQVADEVSGLRKTEITPIRGSG